MGLQVIAYKYTSEPNRLDKTNYLIGAKETTAEIKGTFRADAPELHLNYTGQLAGYNYLRVTIAPGVYYYYYATITAELGQTYRASCVRDPLMTFRSSIKSLPIKSARCEQRAEDTGAVRGFNAYLPDPQRQILQPTLQRRFEIDSLAWQETRILVTVG